MSYNYADLIDNINDAVYFVDKDRTITYWNKAAEKITGFSAKEVVGSNCADNILVHVDGNGNHLCLDMCPLADTIKDGVSHEVEIYLRHKKGHRIPVLVRATPLRDENGVIIGAAELFTDISSKTSMQLRIKELESLALIDNLTQLANRHYIESELNSRFEEKKRYQLSFGVLFMDIDNFKQFNDTYGHDCGDRILKTVTATFRSIVRPFDLVGRWGGEEFIGIIRDVELDLLIEIGERFRALVEKTRISCEGSRIGITISVGATIVRENDTSSSIIKRADSLMYKSKNAGGNSLTAE